MADAGGAADAVDPDDDEVLAEQALTPRSAAEIRMATGQLVRPELSFAPRRPVTCEIDMYLILPDLVRYPGPSPDAPSATGNDQDADALRWRSSRALRYSETTMFVSSSTEVSLLYLSKVILPPCSKFTRSQTGNTWP